MQITSEVKSRPVSEGVCEVSLKDWGNNDKKMLLSIDNLTFERCYGDWSIGGKLIQDAFPMLNPEEREFLMTGMTEGEWEELMG